MRARLTRYRKLTREWLTDWRGWIYAVTLITPAQLASHWIGWWAMLWGIPCAIVSIWLDTRKGGARGATYESWNA